MVTYADRGHCSDSRYEVRSHRAAPSIEAFSMHKPSDSEPPSGRAAKRFRPSPAPAEQGAASLLTAAEGDDESLESWQEPGPYDPAGRLAPWEDRRAAGKA